MRKIPLRTCVGCLAVRPKRELARIVIDEHKEIVVDQTGKASGRGAYLCRIDDETKALQEKGIKSNEQVMTVKKECLQQAQKKKALSRAFKQEAGVNPEKLKTS